MYAQVEARLLNHSYIGTEHVLLALIKEEEGLAAKALESLGISLETVREKVMEEIGPLGRPSPLTVSPPFTPRAKKVLELSLREALQLGHNYIGTEHILLGLVREKDGIAASVLQNLGADLPDVRQKVVDLLDGSTGFGASSSSGSVVRTGEWPRYPMQVVAGPSLRLGSDGVEFWVTGVLFFDESVQVFWQMSGIPTPIIDLMRDPQLFSPNLQEARSVAYVALSL
jgi:ATP-dependent Clp protease ATP-binding subunit ClpC